MQLSLSVDVQKLIEDRVKSGKYSTPEDVVAAAIVTLQQQENVGDFDLGEFDALLAEVEHGTLDGDAAFAARRTRRAATR
jgi:Arc/MetJ-type ribon-helix-helix transcriptional regulator